MQTLIESGQEIDDATKDALEDPVLHREEWIESVYSFTNAVLSGYYDTLEIGLDIVNGVKKLAMGEDVNNLYIRSINYGG